MLVSETKHKYSLNPSSFQSATEKKDFQKRVEVLKFLFDSLGSVITSKDDRKLSPNFGIDLEDISVKEELTKERIIQIKISEDFEIEGEVLAAISRILEKVSEGNDVSIFDYGEWFNISESAKELGVTRPTVYKMIEDGKIKCVVDEDGKKKVSPKSIINYLEDQEVLRQDALLEMAKVDAQLDESDQLDEEIFQDTDDDFEELDL